MLLIKAYILDPVFVFVRALSINIYLSTFAYINFIIKNLGINMNNKIRKRKPSVIVQESFIVLLAISPLIMLYFIL
jgi:hypothetical protein